MQNRIIAGIGSKGTGKTAFSKMLFAKSTRAMVVDTEAEYQGGFICYDPQEMVDYIEHNERFRIVFRPIEDSDFELACRVAKAKRDMLLILEEVSHYCSPSKLNPRFKAAVLRGRHAQLDIIYTTQRFAEVHRSVTSQTDVFVLFRAVEVRDLDAMAERFGDEVADRVSRLDDLQYIKVEARRKNESDFSVGRLGFGGGMVHSSHATKAAATSGDSSSADPTE